MGEYRSPQKSVFSTFFFLKRILKKIMTTKKSCLCYLHAFFSFFFFCENLYLPPSHIPKK